MNPNGDFVFCVQLKGLFSSFLISVIQGELHFVPVAVVVALVI